MTETQAHEFVVRRRSNLLWGKTCTEDELLSRLRRESWFMLLIYGGIDLHILLEARGGFFSKIDIASFVCCLVGAGYCVWQLTHLHQVRHALEQSQIVNRKS